MAVYVAALAGLRIAEVSGVDAVAAALAGTAEVHGETIAVEPTGWLAELAQRKMPSPVRLSGLPVTSDDGRVAMSEVFASTAAVTLPVLALAGVLQIRAPEQIVMVFYGRLKWFNIIANAGPVLAWAVLMLWMTWAEWKSLEALRGRETSDTAAASVQYAIVAALVSLVVFPALRAWNKTQVVAVEDPHWRKKNPDESTGDDPLPESGRNL